jgi:anti-anti-sigma factor
MAMGLRKTRRLGNVTVTADLQAATATVAVCGSWSRALSRDTFAGLRSCFGEHPAGVVLDLRHLSFIDSTGLHLLVALHQRAQRDGLQLTLVAPAAPVDRAIQLCGLDKKLPFVAVVDAEPGESASGPQGDT